MSISLLVPSTCYPHVVPLRASYRIRCRPSCPCSVPPPARGPPRGWRAPAGCPPRPATPSPPARPARAPRSAKGGSAQYGWVGVKGRSVHEYANTIMDCNHHMEITIGDHKGKIITKISCVFIFKYKYTTTIQQ